MKVLCFTSVFALTAISALAGASLDLNGSWAFRFEEGKSIEEVAEPAFSATDTMVVPGCWDTMPQWFLKRGTGLYRRTFSLAEPVENAWLVVDGMGLRGDFRIDGRPLGVHPYPYARLEIETGPLAAGEHTVFAALDNRFDWETMRLARPYYDFYFFGGFYHGVSLSFDNRKLFVRTRDYKTGKIEIEAVNFKTRDFDATLVFDGENEVPASFKNGRAMVNVPNFKLWSPDSPSLHEVSINLSTLQPFNLSTRFGIRTVEARDRRIWLNGEPIFLKGVNRHEQNGEFGAATSEAQMVRDLQLVKSLNANFVRGAHYQQSQRFLDLCDEMGVLVWEESLGWGNGQAYTRQYDKIDELSDEGFRAAQIHETREMVRASFNHPSVILFGFLNECASGRQECKTLVDGLIDAVRAEDSGRLVTFACNHWRSDVCHENTDVVAFNTYPGTIPNMPGLPEELAERVRNLDPKSNGSAGFNVIAKHFRDLYPDKPIIVSECGCGAIYGLHDPAAGVMSEEFQDEYLTDVLEAIWDNPEIVGYAIWQMKDNRTYHRNSNLQPAKMMAGHSIAGIFDIQGRPKKAVETVKRFFAAETLQARNKADSSQMSAAGEYRLQEDVYVVSEVPGYNAWPMIQAVGDKLICTYSRGSGHSIGEGRRDAFARVSEDGGITWGDENVVSADPDEGEVMTGKGLDSRGIALFWVRCIGRKRHHDLYRTADGVRFAKIASPCLDPMPMQITDIFPVGKGLMCLWFATDYSRDGRGSWGTLESTDDGATWTQRIVERELPLAELPTEPSVVAIGGGRLLGIARTEISGPNGGRQFQLVSIDDGETWSKFKTILRKGGNDADIRDSGYGFRRFSRRAKATASARVATPRRE